MVKIIKKVKLNAPKRSSSSSDPTKGTQENPYTQEEFYAFEPDEWPGGWVEGMGYVLPTIYINSSMPSDVSDPFGSWDDINPGTDGSGTDDGSNGSGTGNGDSSGGGGNGGSGSNTGGNSGSDGNSSNKDNESGNNNDQNSNHGITYIIDSYGNCKIDTEVPTGVYQIKAGNSTFSLPGELQAYRGTLDSDDLNFKASFDLFKFLARNTIVEWAFSYDSSSQQGVVNTFHKKRAVIQYMCQEWTVSSTRIQTMLQIRVKVTLVQEWLCASYRIGIKSINIQSLKYTFLI